MIRPWPLAFTLMLLGSSSIAQDKERDRVQATTQKLEQRLERMDQYLQSLQQDQQKQQQAREQAAQDLQKQLRDLTAQLNAKEQQRAEAAHQPRAQPGFRRERQVITNPNRGKSDQQREPIDFAKERRWMRTA